MSKETTPTQKGPSDTHIYIYTGDGGEYRVHPSPAVIRAGDGKVVFRNLCDTGVKLKLKKVPLEARTVRLKPGGTQQVTLSAIAEPGAFPGPGRGCVLDPLLGPLVKVDSGIAHGAARLSVTRRCLCEDIW